MRAPSFVLLLATLSACTGGSAKKEFWIYSSSYKEVLAAYDPELKKAFPEVEIKWFQSGSENVAAKIQAELKGGGTRADMIMTSDLFFYQELKKQKALLPIDAATTSKLPPEAVDPDRAFVVLRFPMMVLAYNKRAVPENLRPQSFKDLAKPQYKDKLCMPSPMESGTALTSSLYFHNLFGEDYFKALRKNNIVAAGGNGATLARIESGEKPVGIVLLENVLQAREKGTDWVEYVVPAEGALPMPSPVALFNSTKDPQLAQKIIAWFLSPPAQKILIKGWNYTVFPEGPVPNGAPAWNLLKKQPWDLKTYDRWGEERQKIKDLFQSLVLSG